jgi:hypothetical protein
MALWTWTLGWVVLLFLGGLLALLAATLTAGLFWSILGTR